VFEKILIANRGEIACRVIKTARRMGIATVAVHSEPDQVALHVQMADQAVCLGPAAAAESYLRIDRVLAACHETGADALHPGYGFLAENPEFAEALAAEGVVFIGPGVSAITAMGDKIASKRLAAEAGVRTIPGFDGVIRDADHALGVAEEIGYPVMLKASAGGGGKGMRVARDPDECREGFKRASSEARSSFGDARMLVEKFIEQPRHIEIQLLADRHGNVVYLGERECSLQRRHQKVIEEAPSSFIDADTRRAMGEQAVKLAHAVGYQSAGTVEFVVDQDKRFYFLEMNTRLQVEHPVTEMVTGLDLVEWMIHIAAGDPLPFKQTDIRLSGWAVEARVYAEDPTRGFLPATGRLVAYREPPEGAELRVDSGVAAGGEIAVHYDPMIAKVIAHGADRGAAVARLRAALDGYLIRGFAHNASFLAAVLGHPRFVAGNLDTGFIDEVYAGGFDPRRAPPAMVTLFAVVALYVHSIVERRAAGVSGQLPGYARRLGEAWVVVINDERRALSLGAVAGGCEVSGEGGTWRLRADWHPGEVLLAIEINGAPLTFQIEACAAGYSVRHAGYAAQALVLTPRAAELHALMPHKEPPDTSKYLLSPMPGLLLALLVEAGQAVKAGEELAVVEAMKMENVLRAERDATVAKLLAGAGESLAVDQPIIEFE